MTAHFTTVVAIPAPSTPLGPFEGSAVAWTTWVTLMGFVGLTAMALVTLRPAAEGPVSGALARGTTQLTRAAVVLGVLAVPAVLSNLAYSATSNGTYDYAAAWDSLYEHNAAGVLSGLELTLSLLGVALLLPFAFKPVPASRERTWLLGAGLAAGALSLITTKVPTKVSDGWDGAIFQTGIWTLHLVGAAVWIGGLAGLLLLLTLPGVVGEADRGAFWSAIIRRFSAVAMTSVAVITLSGLFLYWQHVDGPGELISTMYGRTLGVKLLIFGTLLALGGVNQFWLHPRIEALRTAGDDRPLRHLLVRHFPALIAVELLLGMSVLFIAPLLHNSARNQAFQASLAQRITTPTAAAQLPKIPAKQATAATWVFGTGETVVVVAVMVAGYGVSGRLARMRRTAVAIARGNGPAVPPQLIGT